jgi:predicted membrane channel-forming protein YqfA (hemolysin III family)
MASLTAEAKQEILRGYQRVRLSEVPIVLAVLAGGVVLFLTLQNPSLAIAGLGGIELAVAGGVVLLAGVVSHFVNWRCPGCRRGLQRGVGGLIRCTHCGVVLNAKQVSQPGLTVAESALNRERKVYDGVTAQRLIRGIVVFLGGLAFFLWATPKDAVPQPFGTAGWFNGLRVFGLLIMLGGVWIFYLVGRRMTVGEREHEVWARKKLGMPPAAGGREPKLEP